MMKEKERCERASFDINNNLELPLIDISLWMIFIINSFGCLIMNLLRVMCCVLISCKGEYIVWAISFKFLLLVLS